VPALRRLAAEDRLHEQLYPMDDAVASWPALVVDDATAAAVQHGHAVAASDAGVNEARIYACDGRLLALARYDGRRHAWQPWKVLALTGRSAEGRSVSTAEPGPLTTPG
jgi:tRNA U55 pseudouridine synthase TruB